jgi:sugar lactone lactonase YvrE
LREVFVGDYGNHLIRKIAPSGIVTNFAGSGTAGFSNGVGTGAAFFSPQGVAVDSSGNVNVADTLNNCIRKITSSGIVTTFAGSRIIGSTNGVGADAEFYYPQGVAFDSSGDLYVGDTYNHLIRKITPSGIVTTFAGTAGIIGSTNGVGTNATFYYPQAVAVDSCGNVYVGDYTNHLIRKITPSGYVTTLAGTAGTSGSSNGVGTNARFSSPTGVAVDSSGNVYVGDYLNHLIRKITPSGNVTTLAGTTGIIGSTNGLGTNAKFNRPLGIAVDSSGNVYVCDENNHLIRKMTPFYI